MLEFLSLRGNCFETGPWVQCENLSLICFSSTNFMMTLDFLLALREVNFRAFLGKPFRQNFDQSTKGVYSGLDWRFPIVCIFFKRFFWGKTWLQLDPSICCYLGSLGLLLGLITFSWEWIDFRLLQSTNTYSMLCSTLSRKTSRVSSERLLLTLCFSKKRLWSLLGTRVKEGSWMRNIWSCLRISWL